MHSAMVTVLFLSNSISFSADMYGLSGSTVRCFKVRYVSNCDSTNAFMYFGMCSDWILFADAIPFNPKSVTLYSVPLRVTVSGMWMSRPEPV